MTLKLIRTSLIALALTLLGFFTITPQPTYAANGATTGSNGDICADDYDVPESVKIAAGCSAPEVPLETVIANIVNVIIGVSGIVAVIFIVVGGFNYMTSVGDTQKLEKAKKTILYATIGLAICALAFAIVNYVILNIINQSTTN